MVAESPIAVARAGLTANSYAAALPQHETAAGAVPTRRRSDASNDFAHHLQAVESALSRWSLAGTLLLAIAIGVALWFRVPVVHLSSRGRGPEDGGDTRG